MNKDQRILNLIERAEKDPNLYRHIKAVATQQPVVSLTYSCFPARLEQRNDGLASITINWLQTDSPYLNGYRWETEAKVGRLGQDVRR